jgi:hypothetical protein
LTGNIENIFIKKAGMFQNFKQRLSTVPHKGGIVGALVGALFSFGTHNPGEKTLKKAGKTVLFTGAGYLLGEWIEKKLKK